MPVFDTLIHLLIIWYVMCIAFWAKEIERLKKKTIKEVPAVGTDLTATHCPILRVLRIH